MRRLRATRIERTTLRLVGVPSDTNPARCDFHSGASGKSWVRTRFGSARSSKKYCMNSSRVMRKTKSSSPVPSADEPCPAPPAPPPWGRSIWSPRTYSRLPGCTDSRVPPLPWPSTGSVTSRFGSVMSWPCSMSSMLRPATARRTASRICPRKRRRKRSRLPIDLFFPDKRLSMTCCSMLTFGLIAGN